MSTQKRTKHMVVTTRGWDHLEHLMERKLKDAERELNTAKRKLRETEAHARVLKLHKEKKQDLRVKMVVDYFGYNPLR